MFHHGNIGVFTRIFRVDRFRERNGADEDDEGTLRTPFPTRGAVLLFFVFVFVLFLLFIFGGSAPWGDTHYGL